MRVLRLDADARLRLPADLLDRFGSRFVPVPTRHGVLLRPVPDGLDGGDLPPHAGLDPDRAAPSGGERG